MKNVLLKTACILLLGNFAVASQAASIDFEGMVTGAYYGKTNVENNCGGFYNCHSEDGFVFGTTQEASAPFSHLHRDTGLSNGLAYHGDSGGIYVIASDSGAFSLLSMDVRNIAGDNGNHFRVVGFSETYNNDIVNGTAPFATQVASESITTNGIKTFGEDFSNIKAFWIYYDGYTHTPSDGTNWNIVIDNIELGDPVTSTPVPIPFGGIWFLAMALLSLGSGFGRRQTR